MAARLSAFVMWALVAAGAVFWGYRFWASATPLPANAQVVGDGPGPRSDLTRLLGAPPPEAAEAPAAVAESSRFRLLGVLAPKPGGDAAPSRAGVALIAVDGKRPRAYSVGARVDGELLLSAVSHRSASLVAAGGGPAMVLELPPLLPPATGTLPRAMSSAEGAPTGAPATLPSLAPPPNSMPAGAAPGSPARAAAFQAPPAQHTQAGSADDAEDDEDTSTPAPPPRPRPGAPASR
jgi:general secretion pathway protein C